MAEIEIESVGYNKGLTNVYWYEIKANVETKRAVQFVHYIKPSSYARVGKVNKSRFELEEEKIYCYERHVSVKPNLFERHWFKVVNGEVRILDDTADPSMEFQQRGYSIIGGNISDAEAKDFLAGTEG